MESDDDLGASFGDLDDALLERVACHLPLEDLCRACRVCSRLRDVIMGAQDVWRGLFEATYGGGSGGGREGGYASGAAAGDAGQQAQQAQQAQRRRRQQQQQAEQQAQQAQQQRQQQEEAAAAPGAPSRQPASGGQVLASAGSPGRPPDGAPASALPLGSTSSNPGQLGKRRREGGGEPSRAAAAAAAQAAGTQPAAAVGLDSSSWRERFKARFVEDSRKQRLKRQARRLKADSTLQVLQLEVHRLEQALAQEQRQLPQLQAQLAAVHKARQQASAAALAQVYWQPVAVQQAHGQGVAAVQQPMDAEAAEHDLQQRVAVSQLEVRKLTAALQAARRRAGEAQRKLQALLP